MADVSHKHPEKQQLLAFGLGKLEEDEAEQIAQHLDSCHDCSETILNLQDDTFVGLVRNSPAPEPVDEVDLAVSDEQVLPEETLDVASGATGRTSNAEELPPELLEHPRYEIVGLIGRGGMGDVYKARHRMMDRTVALKIIKRELVQKSDAVDRFHREVKAAAKLSHPNIVTAYDAEQAGDVHFLVMEYIDGVDLSHIINDRGPLPIAEACDYIRQAAVGLQHAHECGMVHRDIKPHNLMVTSDGTVKILDFGLASLAPEAMSDADTVGARGDLTAAGAIMGTPDFISPEQAKDARQADIRSDIYSLGTTLYFLLSGQPPFSDGSVMHKLKSHATAEPDALRTLRDDVPRELESIIARMTAKDPVERFQSPNEVAVALEPFVREPPRRRGPFSRLTALAAGFAAMLLAAAIYFIVTDYGVVRVEVLDDSLNVKIDGERVTVDENGKRLVDFRAGDHEIVVRQGETELITDEFELRRNGEVRFRVTVEKGKVVLAKEGGPKRTADLPGTPKSHPVAAEWSRLAGRWRGVVGAEDGREIEMPFELVVDARKRTMTIGSIVVPTLGGRPSRSVGKPATAKVELDPTMAPNRITAAFPDDRRGKMFGIYKIDGVELTLCLAAAGFPQASTVVEGFGDGEGSRYEFVRVTSQDEIQLVFDIRDGEPVVEVAGQPVRNYRTYLDTMVAANSGIVVRMDLGPGFDPQLGSDLLDFARVVESATYPAAEARTELSPAAAAVLEKHRDRADLLKQRVFSLRVVGRAFHLFDESEGRFPPGRPEDHPEWFDEDGRPHLSWRVHVLPALGLKELHEKFRLDEPWDSAHNKPLLAQMPRFYKTSGDATKTSVQMVVGSGTVYDGKSGIRLYDDIADGASRTALLVDAGTERAVPWTKPQDLPFDAADPIRAFGKSEFGDEVLVLMVDGATNPVPRDTDPEQLRNLFLRGDGNVLDLSRKRSKPVVDDRTAIRGVWRVVSSNGKAPPANVDDSNVPRFVFTADESTRIVGNDSSTRPYRIDPTTSPKRIDLLHEDEGSGRPAEQGIYEFDGDTLRMAFSRGKRPESLEVTSGAAKAVLVLERVRDDTGDPLLIEWSRDARAIRGTWKLESVKGGLPPKQDPLGFKKGLVFGEKTLRPIETTNELHAWYRLNLIGTPKQIDIVVGAADKVLGIYELEADTLRIGYSGEEGKRPTSFARSDVVLTLKWKPEDSDGRRGSARFGFGDRIESLEYSRDGKRLISSGSGWGTAVWDAESGDLVRHVSEEGDYLVASLSPDGTLMATSAWNARTVQVRSVETGEVVCSIDGGFRAVRFAPDGKSVFTVVGNRVARFDVATGERLPAFAGVGGGSSTFAVAPTGTLVAGIASPRNMRVWDWMDVKEVASARSLRMGQGNAKDIVFTPDGKSLVLLGEKNTGADLRDARTLEVTREFSGDENKKSTCVDVSEDGSRMAFGSEGGLVFVYDLKTGELVSSWRAHTGHIAAVALSPDGTRLACGTRRSGSVRIWNVETLKPVFSTDTNQQQIHSVDNAALVYWQAFALLPELSGEDTKLLTDLEKGSELGVDAKSLLTRSKTALSLISHLQPDMPCRWELIENGPSTLLPHLSKARTLARLLVLQARVDAESGKTEAAVDHLTQAFLVARNVDEGVLVQMVVGDAIESLAADVALSLLPKLDASSRDRFAEALSKLPKRTTFTQAMRHERDVFGRGAGKMMSDALEQLGKGEDSPAVRAILAGTEKRQAMWLEELLAEYDKVIEASELPLAEANKNFERIEEEVQDSSNPLIQLMMPSLVGTNQKHARVDARIAKLETRLRDAETSAGKLDSER